jgi:hypothetical protein
LGKTYTIDLSLIDVQTAQIEKSFFRDFKGEIDGLLDLMQVIANQITAIVGGAGQPEVKDEVKIVNLEINSDPEGAIIFINERQVGNTPFSSDAKEGLAVTEDREIEAELEYTEVYKRAMAAADAKEGGSSLWWWIGGGALVVGGAAVLLMSGSDETTTQDAGFPSPPDRLLDDKQHNFYC